MRQWMVNPAYMCRKHLLGEHVEHHMLLGSLQRKKSITGHIIRNQLEPMSLISRHNDIANEMTSRGYSHKSELNVAVKDLIAYLPEKEQNYKVNSNESLRDLLDRCIECSKRYDRLK